MTWGQHDVGGLDEAQALRGAYRPAVLGMLVVSMLVVLAMPIPLLVSDVPAAFVVLGGVIFLAAFGVYFWVWATRRAEAVLDRV